MSLIVALAMFGLEIGEIIDALLPRSLMDAPR
jgi:hypothetical protein